MPTTAPTIDDLRAAIAELTRAVAVLQALRARQDNAARQIAAQARETAKRPPRSAFTPRDVELFSATVSSLSGVVRALQERAGLTKPGEPMASRWS